jgi:uncharacterized protein (DUF488 family)
MLYYRRKILLALLELFGGKLSAIQIQKYLFLFTRLQDEKSFYFVPYKYGCFSYQANQDLTTLGTYGYVITDNKEITLVDKKHYISELTLFDQQYLYTIRDKFESMSQDELVSYIYIHYPYYAINSTIAKQLLTEEQLRKINMQKPRKSTQQLFTIGYEGVSLEQYINKLILEDIHVLCDVRKNAYSQKYGFSKSQLQKACEGVGITYIHVPDLGINSDKRQTLRTQLDYDKLFAEYENTTLKTNQQALSYLIDVLSRNKRIALTCFEKDPKQCHRTRVANAIVRATNGEYPLTHILF